MLLNLEDKGPTAYFTAAEKRLNELFYKELYSKVELLLISMCMFRTSRTQNLRTRKSKWFFPGHISGQIWYKKNVKLVCAF